LFTKPRKLITQPVEKQKAIYERWVLEFWDDSCINMFEVLTSLNIVFVEI